MSYAKRHRVTVTTSAAGAATEYTPVVSGQVVGIVYTRPSSGGLETASVAITGETTETDIWTQAGINASTSRLPTQPTHTQAGIGRVYAGDGEAVGGPIYIAGERIKVAITSGGDEKSGTFDILVAGPTG